MRVFDQNKEYEIKDPDLNKGYLMEDRILIAHHEAIPYSPGSWHYEDVFVFENGGKEVRKVYDVPETKAEPERDEFEPIYVYVPFTKEEEVEHIRRRRSLECFPIINRGRLWYDHLTEEQVDALREWYQEWLDATETLNTPEIPEIIKEEAK